MRNEKKTVKTNQLANFEQCKRLLRNAVQKLSIEAQNATISKNNIYTNKEAEGKKNKKKKMKKHKKEEMQHVPRNEATKNKDRGGDLRAREYCHGYCYCYCYWFCNCN